MKYDVPQKMVVSVLWSVFFIGALYAGDSQNSSAIVEMIDGSRIVVDRLTMAQDRIHLIPRTPLSVTDGNPQKEWSLSLSFVRSIRQMKQTSSDTANDPRWSELVRRKSEESLLVFERNGQLDFFKGSFREMTDSSLLFYVEGQEVTISRAKIYGLIFAQAEQKKLTQPLETLELNDGSVLRSCYDSSRLSEKDRIHWKLAFDGWEGTLDVKSLRETRRSDPKRLSILSQKPESVLSLYPYRIKGKKESVLTEFIAVDSVEIQGKPHVALTQIVPSEMTWIVPDGVVRWESRLAIDDRIVLQGASPHIKCSIYGDDTLLKELNCDITMDPAFLSLEIKGCKKLKIRAEFIDLPESGGIVSWLDPCFILR